MYRFKEAPDKFVDNTFIKGDLKPEARMPSATSPAKQVQILRKYEEKDREVDRLPCISKITSPIVLLGIKFRLRILTGLSLHLCMM